MYFIATGVAVGFNVVMLVVRLAHVLGAAAPLTGTDHALDGRHVHMAWAGLARDLPQCGHRS